MMTTSSRALLPAHRAIVLLLSNAAVTAVSAGGPESEIPDLPQTIELTGIVRDFIEHDRDGGHPDFGIRPDHGYKHYMGNVSPTLGPDNKPVFVGGGNHVETNWHDALGHPICWLLYDEARGDSQGSFGAYDNGGISSRESFDQWYRNILGVNMSTAVPLTLNLKADGTYVFDASTDPKYMALGGFFPIEGQLFGNPGGSPDRNFHFTLEIHGTFVYDANASQFFKFVGDDDVWVFVDGQLVIDIGGVHAAKEQYADLSRLGMVDGEIYDWDFFFAERHRTQSNFRMTTNMPLRSWLPTVSLMAD